MTKLNFRTLAAIAAVSLLSACGGEQTVPADTGMAVAMAPAPYSGPAPSHAGLEGSACSGANCQQGPADLADQYRTESMERAAQDAGMETPAYPHVPQSAIVVAGANPGEVLGTAAGMIVR